MESGARVFVAGHRGLVGAAIMRTLHGAGFTGVFGARHGDLDLRDQQAVDDFFSRRQPQYVFLAAARVGGIGANNAYPAHFIYDNLMIAANVIHAAYQHGVEKLLFLGSTCIYPRLAPQPLREEYLLTGPLEGTNQWYAVAKIAGIKLCQAYRRQYGCRFICAMPTNLYGPGDNFDLETSHVLPALIGRFHEAKMEGRTQVELWGTGTPLREFCHVDDCAAACLHLMQHYDDEDIVNIGVGEDISIRDLAALVSSIVGYDGTIVFDPSKPDGTPRKLVDISRIRALGWQPTVALVDGIRTTYDWFLSDERK